MQYLWHLPACVVNAVNLFDWQLLECGPIEAVLRKADFSRDCRSVCGLWKCLTSPARHLIGLLILNSLVHFATVDSDMLWGFDS